MEGERLQKKIAFLVEVDRLKGVLRRSYVLAGERLENAAEHSWHVALAAAVLAEHAGPGVDLGRVVKMLLCHDVVEIDAGDTFAYDEAGKATQREREVAAADRIFALLPPGDDEEWRALWQEFDAGVTADARFAASVDRLLPILHNFAVAGRSWREHGVTAAEVEERSAVARAGAPALWDVMRRVIEESVARGYLPGDSRDTKRE